MTTVVILPGGFHPYHAGHYALYQSAKRAFPDAEVYVAATNDTSARPFPFAIKEKLATLAGVEPGHFVQVKSPFRAEEITSQFDPEKDTLIFVRSTKDANQPPIPGGVKKDGKPSYLQPLLGAKKLQPFAKHAYMAYLPTVEFGPGRTSATEIRGAWPGLDERRKTALVMSLYPATQKNPKLAATVVKMLNTAIMPAANESKLVFNSVELSENQIKNYAKKYFEAYTIDRPFGKFVSNIKKFGSTKLNESKEMASIEPFIHGIHQVDSKRTVKAGDTFSVLSFDILFAWQEIEVSGFTTPKQVANVKMHSNGTINYVEFTDGDRFPRLTPATYSGKPVVQTAYFDDKNSAEQALTMLLLKVPNTWTVDTSGIESGVEENTIGYIQEENPDYIDEKWSQKYKRSIDCSHPKGFSQRAHCAGRKK